jgi:hypothetical protein
MTARRAVTGLCMICATLASAFAAQAASAEVNPTAVTCVPTKGGTFSDFNCKKNVGQGKGSWEEVNFASVTKITGRSSGNTILKATTGGVTAELTSTALKASGSIENKETSGVMQATGTGQMEYLSVTANHECKVNGASSGTVTTKLLKVHTLSTTELEFEPNSGTTLAEFTLSGCAIPAFNKTWVISGSLIGTVEGTQTVFTHAGTTGQETLEANASVPAGLEGILELLGESGSPLALK